MVTKSENESKLPLSDVPNINWKTINFKRTKYILQLIDTYGPDILYTVDDSGLMPIHWAVVHGKVEIVDKMIKCGVSPRMKARIYDEPEPIHLAALEGNTKIIDLLVSYGIDIDVKDRSGCTPLMRAATYGHNNRTKSSETILKLITYGADVNQMDDKGTNCLHYAAHHDNEDAVHLLLNIGLDPNQRTNEDFRAIDFATNTGSEYLMKLFGPLTDDITESDLHFLILKYQKKGMAEKLIQWLILFARVILVMAIVSAFLYAYPQYILYYLPKTASDIAIHVVLIILNALIMISWYKTCVSDPGFLPLNTKNYNKILDNKIELGLQNQITYRPKIFDPYKDIRLCHTCKTVQTNRSTHCRYCKRCIAIFDHHCIYLSTCIGQNNRMAFFSLGLSLFLTGLLSTYLVVSVAVANNSLFTPYNWFNMCYTILFLIVGFVLTLCNLRRAAINLTTNEELKYRRYSYLTDSEGRFINPFDRGTYLRNIIDYFTTKHYNYSKLNTYEC